MYYNANFISKVVLPNGSKHASTTNEAMVMALGASVSMFNLIWPEVKSGEMDPATTLYVFITADVRSNVCIKEFLNYLKNFLEYTFNVLFLFCLLKMCSSIHEIYLYNTLLLCI